MSMKIPEVFVNVCEVTDWEDVSGVSICLVVSDVVNDIPQLISQLLKVQQIENYWLCTEKSTKWLWCKGTFIFLQGKIRRNIILVWALVNFK